MDILGEMSIKKPANVKYIVVIRTKVILNFCISLFNR